MQNTVFTTIAIFSLLMSSACFFTDVSLENRNCNANSDCLSGNFCVENTCVDFGDAGADFPDAENLTRPDVTRPDVSNGQRDDVDTPDVKIESDANAVDVARAADVNIVADANNSADVISGADVENSADAANIADVVAADAE